MTTELANKTQVEIAMGLYRSLTDDDRRGMTPILRGMALASPRRALLRLVVVNDSEAARARRTKGQIDHPDALLVSHPVAPEHRGFFLVDRIDQD